MQNDSPPRSQQFAKLLDYKGAQALVFLQRDPEDKLAVIVQLWSDTADMQIRALIDVESDDHALVAFDSFTDDTITEFLDSSGLADALRG